MDYDTPGVMPDISPSNPTPPAPDEISAPDSLPTPHTAPTPYSLPDSIDICNPILFAQIHQKIKACDHLVTRERRVLRAVLLNIPFQADGDNALLRRMLSLEPTQFKLLAQIFEDGLLAARNFGDRPSKVGTAVDSNNCSSVGSKRSSVDDAINSENTFSAKRPRIVEPDVPQTLVSISPGATSPAPLTSMEPPSSPIEELFQALGVPHTLPDASCLPRLPRRGSLQDACLARQNRTCAITGRTADMSKLETAHLVPHSIAAIFTYTDAPYWRFLRLILGSLLTNQIFQIVGGSNSFRSSNGLTLDPSIHGSLFDRGIFWLLPSLPVDFDLDRAHTYDVRFTWRADQRWLGSIMTFIPSDPRAQLGTLNLLDISRRLTSGDVFRLYTPDPERYPLPHPLLLSLHAALWEMIAAAGLQDTALARIADARSTLPVDPRRGVVPARAASRVQQPTGQHKQPAPAPPTHQQNPAPGSAQDTQASSSAESTTSASTGVGEGSVCSVSSVGSQLPCVSILSPCLAVEYVDCKLGMHAAVAAGPEEVETEVDVEEQEVQQEAGLVREWEEFRRKLVLRGMDCEFAEDESELNWGEEDDGVSYGYTEVEYGDEVDEGGWSSGDIELGMEPGWDECQSTMVQR